MSSLHNRPGDHLIIKNRLTPAAHDDRIRRTYLGQAHLAGTGPDGATCRECRFWHAWKQKRDSDPVPCAPGYYAKKHKALGGTLKRARCNRPIQNKAKRAIPHSASACRLFERDDNPPPAKKVEQ